MKSLIMILVLMVGVRAQAEDTAAIFEHEKKEATNMKNFDGLYHHMESAWLTRIDANVIKDVKKRCKKDQVVGTKEASGIEVAVFCAKPKPKIKCVKNISKEGVDEIEYDRSRCDIQYEVDEKYDGPMTMWFFETDSGKMEWVKTKDVDMENGEKKKDNMEVKSEDKKSK